MFDIHFEGHHTKLCYWILQLNKWLIYIFQNTPNDLQMLSDAPAHHIFVLLGPVDPDQSSLPEVLCVVQVIYWPLMILTELD